MVLLGVGTQTHVIDVGLRFCPSRNQLLYKRSAIRSRVFSMLGILPEWFFGFLVDFTIVNNQLQGSRSRFSNQEAGTAVMGVVPLLIFFNDACIHAFLDLALDFFNPFLRSGIGMPSHSGLLKLRIQFQVHLDQFFAGQGRRQGAEHHLIGQGQFLQSGVKV